MCNTQKFFVIEPTQRGWRTSKLYIAIFTRSNFIQRRQLGRQPAGETKATRGTRPWWENV